MLFSLDKLDSVPLDRWVVRILKKYYPGKFDAGTSLTPRAYLVIRERILKHLASMLDFTTIFCSKPNEMLPEENGCNSKVRLG